MISCLTGTIARKTPRALIIDVGGVGFKVFAPSHTIEKVAAEKTLSLHTHLAVRDDALDLYGFASADELEFFELLIGISGIGPKSALSILNVASPETIKKAVATRDTSYLTKVSGIGKKTADRIVRELEDKIGALEGGTTVAEEVDVVEALRAIGYSSAEAREALGKIDKKITGTGERVKAALKLLNT